MRLKPFIFFLLLAVFFCAVRVRAAFEDLLTSARPSGMAGAFTAVAEGPENAMLNPAGLGFFTNRFAAASSFSPAFVGLEDGGMYNFSACGAAAFRNIGGFALNFQYFTVNTLDIRNIYAENVLALSFGRILVGKLSAGITLKYMGWSAAQGTDPNNVTEQLNAGFFSMDAGLLYRNAAGTSVGVMAADILYPDITGDRNTQHQPVTLKFGFSFKVGIFLFDFDAKNIGQEMDFAVGSETWVLNQRLGLRAGFQFLNTIAGIDLTMGASFAATDFLNIEYAFQYPLITVQKTWGTHVISVSFKY